MTDLGKDLRTLLAKHFYIDRLTLADRQVSADTTEKFLFCLSDDAYIESVLIPEKTILPCACPPRWDVP